MTKTCKRCKLPRGGENFPPSNMHKDGRGATCLDCIYARNKQNAEKSRSKALLKKMAKEIPKKKKRAKTDAEKLFDKHKKEILDEMFEKHGYYFCQHSKRRCLRGALSIHHIVYKSERRNHPEIHNKRNLIAVYDPRGIYDEAINAHKWFHNKKKRRNELVKGRNLTELFDESIMLHHK